MTNLSISLANVREPILAGQKLVGIVILRVTSVLSGKEIETVLIGEEKTSVSYTTPNGKHTAHGNKCFLRIPIVHDQLLLKTGKLNPGNYQCPFEAEIPETVPSSMIEKSCSNKAEIEYYVSTRILGSGIIYNYHARTNFQVVAKPHIITPTPVICGPVSEKINVCCCLNRGHATIAARLEDTILIKSETVTVYAAARNNSTVPVVRVFAELQETILWQAGGRSHRTSRSLGIVNLRLPTKLAPKKPSQMSAKLMDDEMDVQREIMNGGHSVPITVPMDAKDTYSGQLIRCSHFLSICLETEGFATSPTLKIPVTISVDTRCSQFER